MIILWNVGGAKTVSALLLATASKTLSPLTPNADSFKPKDDLFLFYRAAQKRRNKKKLQTLLCGSSCFVFVGSFCFLWSLSAEDHSSTYSRRISFFLLFSPCANETVSAIQAATVAVSWESSSVGSFVWWTCHPHRVLLNIIYLLLCVRVYEWASVHHLLHCMRACVTLTKCAETMRAKFQSTSTVSACSAVNALVDDFQGVQTAFRART